MPRMAAVVVFDSPSCEVCLGLQLGPLGEAVGIIRATLARLCAASISTCCSGHLDKRVAWSEW